MLRALRTVALGLTAIITLLVALIGGPVHDGDAPAAPAPPTAGR